MVEGTILLKRNGSNERYKNICGPFRIKQRPVEVAYSTCIMLYRKLKCSACPVIILGFAEHCLHYLRVLG